MGNARVFHVRFKQLSYISLYMHVHLCAYAHYIGRYAISTYEYKHFWLAGKYGCRGRDKANAVQLLPSLENREGDQRREYVNGENVHVCVCVCNYSYAFDIFAKDMQTSRAHKQNPMQILLKTQNFKVNTAATRYGDGAEAKLKLKPALALASPLFVYTAKRSDFPYK